MFRHLTHDQYAVSLILKWGSKVKIGGFKNAMSTKSNRRTEGNDASLKRHKVRTFRHVPLESRSGVVNVLWSWFEIKRQNVSSFFCVIYPEASLKADCLPLGQRWSNQAKWLWFKITRHILAVISEIHVSYTYTYTYTIKANL